MTNIAIRIPGIVGIAAISATVAPAGRYTLRRALKQFAFLDEQIGFKRLRQDAFVVPLLRVAGVSACESSKLVRDFVHSLNQQQFDSAILGATIGCFIVSDELRCPESASDQAI
jgi:hypothetical protein